jgi:protein TonB
LSLKRFFAYSFLFHSFILVIAILMIPTAKIKRTGGEFFTRLVSPDEISRYQPSSPPLPQRKLIPNIKSAPSVKRFKGDVYDNHVGNIAKSEGHTTQLPAIPNIPKQPLVEGEASKMPGESKIIAKGKPTEPSLKDKLFDKGVIGDIAKKETKRDEIERKDKTFTFDVSEYKYLVYNRRLKERIESIWIYPPTAASRGIYGDLFIKFTIKKNGSLGEIELVRTSGHKELDDAAIKALKDGAPYWPLPDDWGMDSYTILGHFVYTIYGYYIR